MPQITFARCIVSFLALMWPLLWAAIPEGVQIRLDSCVAEEGAPRARGPLLKPSGEVATEKMRWKAITVRVVATVRNAKGDMREVPVQYPQRAGQILRCRAEVPSIIRSRRIMRRAFRGRYARGGSARMGYVRGWRIGQSSHFQRPGMFR